VPVTISSLANRVQTLKDTDDRSAPCYGLAVHTTGSSIVAKARKEGADPLEFAVAYYLQPESYWSHYLIGWSGQIIQISDERERAQHIGMTAVDRAKYASGAWVKEVSAATSVFWDLEWSRFARSPNDLYPGKSPNNVYIGVELLPVDDKAKKSWDDKDWWKSGVRFTLQQHWSVVELAKDIAKRHGWPDYWWKSGRLVGHEDVSPLQRQDKGGGWDVGALRNTAYFKMPLIRAHCGGAGLDLDY
jgi:hypothetical protein